MAFSLKNKLRAPLNFQIYYEPALILKGLARVNATKYQLLKTPAKLLFLIGNILILVSCISSSLPPRQDLPLHSPDTYDLLRYDLEALDRRVLGLLTHAEKSYAWRQKADSLHPRMDQFLKQNKGRIASHDLQDMQQLIHDYLHKIREPLVVAMRSSFYSMDFKNGAVLDN
jgi:hypothetical protein